MRDIKFGVRTGHFERQVRLQMLDIYLQAEAELHDTSIRQHSASLLP